MHLEKPRLVVILLLLLFIYEQISNPSVWATTSISASKEKSHPARSIYWRSNSEGLYSHFIQLKILVYARKVAKSDRTIMIEDFHSKHYGHMQADTRICNILQLPYYIQCVPYHAAEDHIPCENDIRVLFSPNDHTCFSGYPYWANTKQLSGKIKHEVAPAMPRLTFKGKYLALAEKVKAALGLTGDYVAIQWRRGDQLSIRCVRNKYADESFNCGDGHDFLNYLNETIRPKYSSMPIVVLSNENNATILQFIREMGAILVNEDVVVGQLNLSLKNFTSPTILNTTTTTTSVMNTNGSDILNSSLNIASTIAQRVLTSKSSTKSKKTAGLGYDIKEKDKSDSRQGKSSKNTNLKYEDSDKKNKRPHIDKKPNSQAGFKNETIGKKLRDGFDSEPTQPRVNSKSATPGMKKVATAEATAALTQLAIDSILQLDAKVFLAFGISTFHDVIEAERKLRGKSYCTEPQGVLSFCHGLTDPSSVSLNSTLLPYFSKSAVHEYLKEHNPSEGIPYTTTKVISEK